MQSLSVYDAIANRYQHLRTLRTNTMMKTLSHHIERQVLKYSMPIDFYVGFQRFSAFHRQTQRYEQLGSVCKRVYIFGLPDTPPPTISDVEFIELVPDALLTQEWFLLVDAPEFWTLVSMREIHEIDYRTGERCFEGIWTFDAPVVESASRLLAQAVGHTYTPHYQRYASLQEQNVTELMQGIFEHFEKTHLSSDSPVNID